MEDLAGLIAGFEDNPQFASELREAFVRHVKRVTSRYPDAYFELGKKCDESIEGLADRSFVVCAKVKKGRFPFSSRTPFSCYIEERFDDPPIRYHSFYAKLSVARELMRDDYAFNLRRDPILRWRDDLHREIGVWLKEHAQVQDAGGGSHRRWSLAASGPQLIRPDSGIIEKLKGLKSQEIDRLLPEALRLAGQPVAHSRLSNWLAEVLVGPMESLEEQLDPRESYPREVREAVAEAWNKLSESERILIISLAHGDSYDSLIAKVPAFRDRSSVSRAVKSCGGQFVAAIHKALDLDIQNASATPKEVIERVIEVLLPMVPELAQKEVS